MNDLQVQQLLVSSIIILPACA